MTSVPAVLDVDHAERSPRGAGDTGRSIDVDTLRCGVPIDLLRLEVRRYRELPWQRLGCGEFDRGIGVQPVDESGRVLTPRQDDANVEARIGEIAPRSAFDPIELAFQGRRRSGEQRGEFRSRNGCERRRDCVQLDAPGSREFPAVQVEGRFLRRT